MTINDLMECQSNNHNLQELYRWQVDQFEEDVVVWCQTCGCVKVYREHECGRVTHEFTETLIPDVAKAYWNDKHGDV